MATIERAYELACQQLSAGDWRQAETLFRQILKSAPNIPEVHNYLGVALAQQGQLNAAVASFRQALFYGPDYPEAHNDLGSLLQHLGELDNATVHFHQAVRLRPEYAEAHKNLAAALAKQGKVDQALFHYRETVRLKPDQAKAHFDLGVILYGQGLLDQAVAHHQAAARLQPQCAEAHYNLGNALYGQGKTKEAIPSYRQALKLAPTLGDTWNRLGEALAQHDELDEAVQCFRRAIGCQPQNAVALANLAAALNRRGNYAVSVDQPRQLLDTDSDAPATNPELGLTKSNEPLNEETAKLEEISTHSGRVTRQRISIIICSTNAGRFNAVSNNYAALLAGEPFEVVRISDARSLCEGYTRGIARSRGEWLLFCHDDIEILNTDFAARLKEHMVRFDLIGVAGTSRLIWGQWAGAGPSFIYGQIAEADGQQGFVVKIFGVPSRAVGRIQAVDGVFLAARRRVVEKIPFDAITFDGFHHYDLDFSFAAYLAGFRLAVATDIHVLHHSTGPLDQSWQHYFGRFNEKYARQLHTMSPPVFTLASVHVSSKEQALEIMRRNVEALGGDQSDEQT